MQTQQVSEQVPDDLIDKPKPADPSEQIEKAKTAVVHVIEQIRNDEYVRYRMGYGTESFELLTEAAASLCGEPLARVRAYASGFPMSPVLG